MHEVPNRWSNGATFLQLTPNCTRVPSSDWRWRFWGRDSQMLLKLCGLVGLLLPERWTVTCKGLAASKCPSELACCFAAHAPQPLCFVDNCSRWANWWLIVTLCHRIGPLRNGKLTCKGKAGFYGPNESFCGFPSISNYKTWIFQQAFWVFWIPEYWCILWKLWINLDDLSQKETRADISLSNPC